LTALTIQASHSQNALAWCNFHSFRKMPSLPQKSFHVVFHKPYVFSISCNHGSPAPFHVELSCSGLFMRRLPRIADWFYCFILVGLWKTNVFSFNQWKILLKDLKPKDNYNKGTMIFIRFYWLIFVWQVLNQQDERLFWKSITAPERVFYGLWSLNCKTSLQEV